MSVETPAGDETNCPQRVVRMGLSLSLSCVEGGYGTIFGLVGDLDFAEGLLIFVDVALQSLQQSLHVLRSHDDAAAHLCFGHTGKYASKVEDKVRT